MRTLRAKTGILVLAAMTLVPDIEAQEQLLSTEFKRLQDGRGELAVTNNSETAMITGFVVLRQSFGPGRTQPLTRGIDLRDVLFTPEQHDFADAIQSLERTQSSRLRRGGFVTVP